MVRSPRLSSVLCPLWAGLLLVTALVAVGLGQTVPPPAKRPITHADYDSWRKVQLPVLSRDGAYLAYNLMPADGDGEFIVRNLVTGSEQRVPRGRSGLGAPGAGENKGAAFSEQQEDEDQRRLPGAPPVAGEGLGQPSDHQFTPDSKAVVFSLPPTRAEIDKARQEKRSPAEMPRPVVAVMELASGKIMTKIEGASRFAIVGEGPGLLVYRRQTKPSEKVEPAKDEKQEAKPMEKKDDKAPVKTPARTYGTDLVLRNLAHGGERILEEVSEHTITRDGKMLVYAVSSKNDEQNGVYTITDLPKGVPMPLVSGKGRYWKLTWDEKQTQLVFFTDRDDVAAEKPKAKLYHWGRPIVTSQVVEAKEAAEPRVAPATDLLTLIPTGIRPGWLISERGSIRFSADGARIYVSTAPDKEEKKEPAPATKANEEKAAFDLWHYKDELIQPMQKARGGLNANRTYAAVYHIRDKVFRQLADETVEVAPPTAGDWALGADSRPYRKLTGFGAALNDYSLVHVRTGERKLLLQASPWRPNVCHDGKHLVYFDGKHWHAAAVAGDKRINLTAKLPVKFFVEDWDQPSEAPAYGLAVWSSDGRYVLLEDRYDVWKVAIDGSEAKMLTAGLGRKTQTQLRVSRWPGSPPDEEVQHGFDLSRPLMVKGFYRLEPGAAEPKLLVMGARAYGLPVKAKNADAYLLTISTFSDYPDYYVTGADFRELKRVTDANPKKNEFVWGKSELVRYRNLDGVELSGMLIKPENFDPQQKYPMIVYIYERLSQNLHRFVAPSAGTSINPTYYASNGYLVFMPDIVYTVGSPGHSALPGVQAVMDRGYVNDKAIGIQGHSWGGYQIAYMVTQTTRFKAAAAGAPVSDMVSAYDGIRWGTGLPRQFQYERTQSRIGASLWQAPQKFIENSPIFMADRVQTPLLMLHNDQDDAVPWYQGIEYYLALRRLNKECYLFNYVGEFHGLRKKVNQKDYTVRMQQFFDHHLKGAAKPEWMEKGIPYKPRADDRPSATVPLATMEENE
jgi:dienelactone hydrolase